MVQSQASNLNSRVNSSVNKEVRRGGSSKRVGLVNIGTDVGLRAWPDELDFNMHTIIYRLLEVDGESDYAGPLMIDAEGIVRVAGELDESQSSSYSFIIEALCSDGMSSQSPVQTLTVSEILESKRDRLR